MRRRQRSSIGRRVRRAISGPKKIKPKDKRLILGLIVLSGVWGFGKNYMQGRRAAQEDMHDFGPELGRMFAQAGVVRHLDPSRILHLSVIGPMEEELMYRGAIQPQLGLMTTSALFGAAHISTRLPPLDAISKAIDAMAGGVVYGVAAQAGGVPASFAAHAVHNFFSGLGMVAGALSV